QLHQLFHTHVKISTEWIDIPKPHSPIDCLRNPNIGEEQLVIRFWQKSLFRQRECQGPLRIDKGAWCCTARSIDAGRNVQRKHSRSRQSCPLNELCYSAARGRLESIADERIQHQSRTLIADLLERNLLS